MKVNSNTSTEGNIQTSGIESNTVNSKTNEPSFLKTNENSFTGGGSAIEKNLVDRNRILQTGLNNTFAANSQTRFDYNQIQGVRNNPHVTAEFLNGVENMAQRLGTRPEYILAVMSF